MRAAGRPSAPSRRFLARPGSSRHRLGEVILLATRWQHTFGALERAGRFDDRVVIDATNPSTEDGLELVVGHETSGAEQIARAIPEARLVKAFNHIYAEVLSGDPPAPGILPAAFYCGDDAAVNARAGEFIRSLGFDAVFAGPLSVARYLEPAAQLMVSLVEGQGLPAGGVALALLRRPALLEARG